MISFAFAQIAELTRCEPTWRMRPLFFTASTIATPSAAVWDNRLLDVDVFAGAHRFDDHAPMPVIGHRRHDAIDVLVVEQPAILARGRRLAPAISLARVWRPS